MANLRVNWTRDDAGQENLSVNYAGKNYVANNTHPCWSELLAKALDNDPTVIDLFDIGMAVGQRLELSDRVSYAKGFLFLDGDKISDGLADHIVRMVQAEEDVQPFVMLLENILQNPSKNSREQLYRYIDKHKITITRDGTLVLYKYVFTGHTPSVSDPTKVAAYRSGNMGPALVNGAPHKEGYVPQDIGDVVSMPRSEVADDPNTACSTGLHVGAWSYVGNNGNVRLEIHVHPRDVVSVPRDAEERKIRVCRYKIIQEVTKPYDEPVLPMPEPEPELVIDDIEPIEGPVLLPVEPSVKHPTQKEFDKMKGRARRRRRNFVKYAQETGKWKLVQGTGGDPKDWSVK